MYQGTIERDQHNTSHILCIVDANTQFKVRMPTILFSSSDVKKRLQQFRADRKVDDLSLYAEIDDNLEKHKIYYRSAYHSGQINGIGIKLFMENTAEIMMDIKELFLQKRTDLSGAANVLTRIQYDKCRSCCDKLN